MINLIYASDLDGVIGINNSLPWHLPRDLERFKELTLGHKVLMGRKTFESLPCYPRGLVRRENIVVSKTLDNVEGVSIINSLEDYLKGVGKKEVLWVIGGVEIYEAVLPYVDNVYHTLVGTKVDGDVVFKFNSEDFSLISEESHVLLKKDGSILTYSFLVYERNNKS